jgi:hypothetical protein
MRADESTKTATFDAATVRRLCGDISDQTVTAVLATGASLSDLEAAVAWLEGESEIMGEQPDPLAGAAAQIYDLLLAEEGFGEER